MTIKYFHKNYLQKMVQYILLIMEFHNFLQLIPQLYVAPINNTLILANMYLSLVIIQFDLQLI